MKRLSVVLALALAGPLLLTATARGGYSHYFTWNHEPDPKQLAECLREMGAVLGAANGLVAGPEGTGKPLVGAKELSFNGVGEGAHEPFDFPGEQKFNFCKTAGKPYDAAVTACLLVARDHFPANVLEIASDGDWDDGAWDDGARLYEKALGRPANNPMRAGVGRPERGGKGPGGAGRGDGLNLHPAVSLVVSVVFFAFVLAVMQRVRPGSA